MKRTFTEVGKLSGYTPEEIENAISRIDWEVFRRDNLPFCQGEAIRKVVNGCNIPLKKISRMALHGVIKESHGFYGLDVKYKNGQAQIYMADNGCEIVILATDFTPLTEAERVKQSGRY